MLVKLAAIKKNRRRNVTEKSLPQLASALESVWVLIDAGIDIDLQTITNIFGGLDRGKTLKAIGYQRTLK